MTISRSETRRGRFYEVPGVGKLPSVTTILSVIGKPALINWAANTERELVLDCSADLYESVHGTPKMSRMVWISTMQSRLGQEKAHKRELAKAGDIGSQTHSLIEWVLRTKLLQKVGPSPRITDKAQWAFMVFEDWAKKVGLKPILIEQTVYSRDLGCAGTMDLLAEVSGELAVVDFKTGKAVYPEAHLQVNTYKYSLREMGHGDISKAIIVRLPKNETDPEAEIVEADPEPESIKVFKAVKSLWEWSQMKDAWLKAQEEKEASAA